ncbi:pilus assembly protein PilW [Vibrio parahaemolyticus]|nr:pilus assembly protein PilW [Vibrio parahaemolyticus]EHH2555110.1 pilus assembly protein PilW [Vibrio parahaemolyticus]EHH2557148.1 pilus assembly protein PilW [Vibrio parahaemolyticus]EHK2859417.1 pilus assembly protein PilW [Vibrio parahaemolyticus]
MITLNASRRYQIGSSLIELMISSLIGLMVLGIIGSIFISIQQTAKEKSLELNLLQGLNITLAVMKEDIQRAGYDGGHGMSLKLFGASETITVSGASSIGFVYFRDDSPLNKNYRNIKYEKRDSKLVICENGVVSQAQILSFDGVDFCRSLFDEDIFQVTNFTVNSKVVTNGTNISAVTDVTLALQTVDGVINQVAEFSIKQRNWQ